MSGALNILIDYANTLEREDGAEDGPLDRNSYPSRLLTEDAIEELREAINAEYGIELEPHEVRGVSLDWISDRICEAIASQALESDAVEA